MICHRSINHLSSGSERVDDDRSGILKFVTLKCGRFDTLLHSAVHRKCHLTLELAWHDISRVINRMHDARRLNGGNSKIAHA